MSIGNLLVSYEIFSCDKFPIYMRKENFIDWLEKQLREREWTQADLARNGSMNQSVISNLVNGKRNPGKDVCVAIARALHLPPEEVFRRAGLLPPKPEENAIIENIKYHATQLPKEDQQDILEYTLLRQKLREDRTNHEISPRTQRRPAKAEQV
jgi:transcriptional regulator with XRE-family HTH domain